MIEDVFIIGATGKVGKTLVKQISQKGDTSFSKHVNPTRIVGLASSSSYVYSKVGVGIKESDNFINKGKNGFSKYKNLSEILEKIKETYDNKNSNLVFVDVTGVNGPMLDFHKDVIFNTDFGIVTANKNPIAFSDFETFQKLTQDTVRYGYRCSVLAGAEAISLLQDLKDVSDYPMSIKGCFSGTLGYITSELEKGKNLSDIVRDAYRKGFTEPHPRDDLNGLDVARKLLILTRTAGYNVEMEDIKLDPLVDQGYLGIENVSEFFSNLRLLDKNFDRKVREAKLNGNVLRYVASMSLVDNIPKLEVGLKEVQKNSPLGNLTGTRNKIIVESESYPKGNEYIVEAPGAGLEVTAQNVRRDLLYQLVGRKNLI